jgi:hypothetical protein
VACFIGGRLLQPGPCGIDIADLTRDGVGVVRPVQAQERLALMHPLTAIDQALDDFAGDAKAQITLDARGYNTRERSRARLGGLHDGDLHKLRNRSRILRGL